MCLVNTRARNVSGKIATQAAQLAIGNIKARFPNYKGVSASFRVSFRAAIGGPEPLEVTAMLKRPPGGRKPSLNISEDQLHSIRAELSHAFQRHYCRWAGMHLPDQIVAVAHRNGPNSATSLRVIRVPYDADAGAFSSAFCNHWTTEAARLIYAMAADHPWLIYEEAFRPTFERVGVAA